MGWFWQSKQNNEKVSSMSQSQVKYDNSNKICTDCNKDTNQKPLPEQDNSASKKGMPCYESYKKVSECMAKQHGQVSACKEEWKVFRDCHDLHKQTKQ